MRDQVTSSLYGPNALQECAFFGIMLSTLVIFKASQRFVGGLLLSLQKYIKNEITVPVKTLRTLLCKFERCLKMNHDIVCCFFGENQ